MWIRKTRLWKNIHHMHLFFLLGYQKPKKNKMWKKGVETVEISSVAYVDKEILTGRRNPILEPVAFLFILSKNSNPILGGVLDSADADATRILETCQAPIPSCTWAEIHRRGNPLLRYLLKYLNRAAF